jgi:hypothetical protein
MPVISAVIAKHKFVEIGIDVLAAQAVICPEAPSSHQRKSSMNPRQHNVRGHLANDARIMPVACQTRIGFVAVGEQRGSTLHVGVYEGFDRGGGIVGDHGEANAAGTRVEIFGVLASRFGLFCVALDDFDSPDDEDFAGVSGFEECIAFAKVNFGLINFDDAFQWFAISD